MSKLKSVNECETDRDFETYCNRYNDVEVRNGKGSHKVVVAPRGSVAIPHGKIKTGTKIAIIKQLAAIGITIFFIGYFLVTYGIL